MGDVTVKVLTPADDFALVALEDAKIMLSIAASDTSEDQQLALMIEQNSRAIATMCNRTFAKERVRETHRDCGFTVTGRLRIYLTHYPVKEEDIESVESPAGTVITNYELDEENAKLTIFGAASNEVVVEYTGGYDLPDESPMELQQALAVTVRETRTAAVQAAVSGIRMISHKSARVMFHPASAATSSRTGGTATSATQQALENLLMKFTRIEI